MLYTLFTKEMIHVQIPNVDMHVPAVFDVDVGQMAFQKLNKEIILIIKHTVIYLVSHALYIIYYHVVPL